MKKLFFAITVCAVLAFTGCIDREFELTEISGEVTVGGEELVVPLADVSTVYISDIIPSNDMLTNNDDGVYQIYFSSFGTDPSKFESIAIDKIDIPSITGLSPKLDPVSFDMAQLPESLSLDNINQSFTIDFPTLGEAVKVEPIYMQQQLEIELPSELSGSGYLPDYVAAYLPALKGSNTGNVSFKAEISILEQLNGIHYVHFGSDTEPGAPFGVTIDLRGVAGINGGGSIYLNMRFPKGYHLLDVDQTGKLVEIGNVVSRHIEVNKYDPQITLFLYLKDIDYLNHPFTDGYLRINDVISYDYNLNLAICEGNYDIRDLPEITISATPIYKDIEVVINHFDLPNAKYDVKYEFPNLPKEIDINKIAFTENSSLLFQLKGLEWLNVHTNDSDEYFSPYLVVKFPPCMHFRHAELANPINNNARDSMIHLGGDNDEDQGKDYILTASAAALASGIRLYIDHIDGKDSSIARVEDALVIDTTIEAGIHLESLDGHHILASAIIPPVSPLNIEFNMENMNFIIDKERSEVEMNEMVLDLKLDNQLPSISQEIDIPEMISSIERIAIGKANGNGAPVAINFSLETLNGTSFPVNEIDLDVAINIGKLLRPTEATKKSGLITINDKDECILTIKKSWNPNQSPLSAHIEFDALENIPEIVNGKLKLDQAITIEKCWARIKEGENIDLSAISNAAIDMKIQIDDIEVREFTGGLNVAIAPEEMVIELGDLSDLGVDVNELSINPTLALNLKDNPTGIPFFTDIAVKAFNANGDILTEVVIPTIEIAASGSSSIVISTSKNVNKYPDASFVNIDDLSKLLSNGIPAKIAVNMAVATDNTKPHTIDLARAKNGFNIEYQYEVIIPLEFDGGFNLAYGTTINGLNDTFANLANNVKGLKVGDIGLIAEFNTTIPFDIQLSAKLVDSEGKTEDIDAKLNIGNNGIIEGWTEQDGSNPHTSKLDIEFSLGSSHSLSALKDVDGIQLSFALTNSDSDNVAAIKDTQYLNGNFKLRVRDGLSVDIFDFLKQKEE